MRPFTVHSSISAPREEVFDLVGDMAAKVAWCDHFLREFHLTRPRSSGVGAAARFRIEAPLVSSWCELAITEYDRPRRIVERGRAWRLGRTPTVVVYELIPEHGVTRVELTAWTEPATHLDAFKESLGARRWLRRQTKTALERLRLVFEEERQAPLARVGIAGYEPLKAPRFGSS